MPRGGKRPGAGRPKGSKEKQTLNKELAREKLRERVFEKLFPMTDAQIDAAIGIKFLVVREKKSGKYIKRVTEDGDLNVREDHEVIEVYAKDPSAQAYSYLVDQAIDKAVNPKQELDVNITGLSQRLKAAKERLARG